LKNFHDWTELEAFDSLQAFRAQLLASVKERIPDTGCIVRIDACHFKGVDAVEDIVDYLVA